VRRLLDVPLLAGPLPWVVTIVGLAGVAVMLAFRDREWWTRVVPSAVIGAALLTMLATLLVEKVWRPFPDPLPPQVMAAVGVTVAVTWLGVVALGRRGWRGRMITVLAVFAVLLAAAQSVNGLYRQYPTLRMLLGLHSAYEVPFAGVARMAPLIPAPVGSPLVAEWSPPAGMPASGVVAAVHIPGVVSGFRPRAGRVYLPPAYLASPRPELPVLVLLSGQPGSPNDWIASGGLPAIMDSFAAAHQGLAPVVVLPDYLGSTLANPLCMDSKLGKIATYLSVDVPAWIRSNLQVDNRPSNWSIGGFSNGGTCSLQMAVTSPRVYPTFVDISGESEPTLGDHAATVKAAFGGDEAAFRAVNPLDVLTSRQFPGSAGFLVAGANDPAYRPNAQQVYAATRAAGMNVQMRKLPGGHTWAVWAPGLQTALPWLARRLELIS